MSVSCGGGVSLLTHAEGGRGEAAQVPHRETNLRRRSVGGVGFGGSGSGGFGGIGGFGEEGGGGVRSWGLRAGLCFG